MLSGALGMMQSRTYYPTWENKTGKRGHPKRFDGRIDFANLELTRCKEYEVNKERLYGLRVYAKALKRYVFWAIWYPMDGEDRQVSALFIYRRFHGWTRDSGLLQNPRVQLEFCFRDGKQHAGITNCQSTDFRKLDFHFNALAAINLAKAACKRLGITDSITSCKSFIHNAYMPKQFACS